MDASTYFSLFIRLISANKYLCERKLYIVIITTEIAVNMITINRAKNILWDNLKRVCILFIHQSLYVFTDDIKFKIDKISNFELMQVGEFPCIRNDGNRKFSDF